jgi:hypothetical protein
LKIAKYVSSYCGGVRKMNFLAKVQDFEKEIFRKNIKRNAKVGEK